MAIEYDPDEIERAIQAEMELIMRELAGRVHTDLVLATPVGNPTLWQNPESAPPGYVGGHARINWRVHIGQRFDGEISGEDGSGRATISAASAVINGYRNRKNFPPIYIQNGVPYMNRLNNGHSTQAPVGFIENAIDASVRAIKQAKNI